MLTVASVPREAHASTIGRNNGANDGRGKKKALLDLLG
jgi:hypothetical protein